MRNNKDINKINNNAIIFNKIFRSLKYNISGQCPR